MAEVFLYTVPEFKELLAKIFDLPEIFEIILSRELILNEREALSVKFTRTTKETITTPRRIHVFVADGEKWHVRSRIEIFLKELNIKNLTIDDFHFRERSLMINEIV